MAKGPSDGLDQVVERERRQPKGDPEGLFEDLLRGWRRVWGAPQRDDAVVGIGSDGALFHRSTSLPGADIIVSRGAPANPRAEQCLGRACAVASAASGQPRDAPAHLARSVIESSEDQPEQEAEHAGRIARARATAEELQRRARGEFEEARARHESVRLAVEIFESDRARAGGLLAGGLAYRIFLWQIPFVLFLVSALGLATELSGTEPADLARQAGLAAALSSAIAQAVAASGEGRIWLLILGASLAIWAGRGVFRGSRLVSELAWGARAARGSALKGSLAVNALGVALVALQALLPKVTAELGLPAPLRFILGLLLASSLALWVLSLLPRADAPWVAVVPGALLLGVGLRLLGLAASTYFAFRLDQANDLYGSLSIAIVLMLYLFLLARLFVGAQFLNVTLYRRKAVTTTGD